MLCEVSAESRRRRGENVNATSRGLWDADHHYYETRDCFTRHMESAFADMAIQPRQRADGSTAMMFGDHEFVFPVAKFDACEPPGSLRKILSGSEFKSFEEARKPENMDPAFTHRGPRLRQMDEQGVEGAVFLPTFASSFEQETLFDVPALLANVRSLNRWIEEQWGFAFEERIFAAPYISLADRDEAVHELERVRNQGARLVFVRPGPVNGRSLADPYFDRFWAIMQEAELPLALHLADSPLLDQSAVWGESPRPNSRKVSALQWAFYFGDRAIMETAASMIFLNFFKRFPGIRVMSIENGCRWIPYLLGQLDKGAKLGRNGPWPCGRLTERASTIFKQNFYVTSYPEEDGSWLAGLIGADRALLGSDFPHPEGFELPTDFLTQLTTLPEEDRQRITRSNLRELLHVA
jgi:predicted TIM-barrel fold metal-dependent hydrolase